MPPHDGRVGLGERLPGAFEDGEIGEGGFFVRGLILMIEDAPHEGIGQAQFELLLPGQPVQPTSPRFMRRRHVTKGLVRDAEPVRRRSYVVQIEAGIRRHDQLETPDRLLEALLLRRRGALP